MRKPEPSTEKTDEQEHPAKKPRLQKDDSPVDTETRPAALANRKPLLQVRNVGQDSAVKAPPSAISKEDASFERFFNALWLVYSATGHFCI